jgi:DNA repair exonuclease SbcCD ATPase subunit
MKNINLDPEWKKKLAKILKEINLMPNNQGRLIINITPDQTIGSVEVTNDYR